MIKIILTTETIESEPGPNLYWRGKCQDFLKLVVDLHQLAKSNGIEIDLNDLNYVNVIDGYCIKAISSENGCSLVEIDNTNIKIDCTSENWRNILQYFLSISFFPSHNYVEFDDKNLLEQANFIISSEG